MLKCLDQKMNRTRLRTKPLPKSSVRHADPWLAGYRRRGCGWPVGSDQHATYLQGLADADTDEAMGGNAYQPYAK